MIEFYNHKTAFMLFHNFDNKANMESIFNYDYDSCFVTATKNLTSNICSVTAGSVLINMNARLYDPVVGRFLSPDPIVQDPTNSQSFNRYSYCLNNSLKYTDLTGMQNRWWANQYTYNWSTGQYEDYYGNNVEWNTVWNSIQGNNGVAWGWDSNNGFGGTGSSGGFFGNGGFGGSGGYSRGRSGSGGGSGFLSGIGNFFKNIFGYSTTCSYLTITGNITDGAVIDTDFAVVGTKTNKNMWHNFVAWTNNFQNNQGGFHIQADWGLGEPHYYGRPSGVLDITDFSFGIGKAGGSSGMTRFINFYHNMGQAIKSAGDAYNAMRHQLVITQLNSTNIGNNSDSVLWTGHWSPGWSIKPDGTVLCGPSLSTRNDFPGVLGDSSGYMPGAKYKPLKK